jgi:hypothetical protein
MNPSTGRGHNGAYQVVVLIYTACEPYLDHAFIYRAEQYSDSGIGHYRECTRP